MSTLKVTFTNSSNTADDKVYIGFLKGKPLPGEPATGFDVKKISLLLRDGGVPPVVKLTPLDPLDPWSGTYPQQGNWYLLSDLKDGVEITSFSGRIYVSYGTPWTVVSNGYTPGQAVTDVNFWIRNDKMEMTFTGSASDVANLTSIDFWSIPMTLKGYMNESLVHTVNGLKTGVTAKSLHSKLTALTTPPVSGLPSIGGVDGDAIPAEVPGKYKLYPSGDAPSSDFVRVIGPSSYPPAFPSSAAGRPVMPYDTFGNYLDHLVKDFGPSTTVGAKINTLGKGTIAHIAGTFAGVGPSPTSNDQKKQTYTLTATIDADKNITLDGSGSVVGSIKMEIKQDDLRNPTGIYGGNAPYYLNGSSTSSTPGNDIYGWILGDLFSGLNIGAVGSETEIKAEKKKAGELTSSEWFSKIPQDLHFSGLQSNPDHYNQYAATLAANSDAYNFAYTDRFSPVFLTLNPATVNYMQVELLDDTVS